MYAIVFGSNEYTYFWERKESFYNMLILVTTANFPDIMLPSYEHHWTYCLFFVLFLLIALYLFLNILLANFYNKFQQRLAREGVHIICKQENYLQIILQRFDKDSKGYLNAEELTLFFKEILQLKINTKQHDFNTF